MAALPESPPVTKTSFANEFPNASEEAWRALVDKALKGAKYDDALVSETYDGLRIKPLYTRQDETSPDPAGLPGRAPFARGLRQTVDQPPWEIRQLYAGGDPATANTYILADLEGGTASLTLRLDHRPHRAGRIGGRGGESRGIGRAPDFPFPDHGTPARIFICVPALQESGRGNSRSGVVRHGQPSCPPFRHFVPSIRIRPLNDAAVLGGGGETGRQNRCGVLVSAAKANLAGKIGSGQIQ